MIIGDDWLTKSMLINTISRTGNRSLPPALSNTGNLFAEVFTQYLQMQNESKAPQLGILPFTPIPESLNLSFEKNITFFSEPFSGDGQRPLHYADLNSDRIDQSLGGKLTGMGKAFIQAGQKYNINPALLVAVAQHETGNGTSKAAAFKNNIAGMMGKYGLKSYASVEESIFDMARNLSENYLKTGLTSITKIAAKYAPVGAANDPNGLNNHWVTGVTKYFDKLIT